MQQLPTLRDLVWTDTCIHEVSSSVWGCWRCRRP